jgi:hypothetical protein
MDVLCLALTRTKNRKNLTKIAYQNSPVWNGLVFPLKFLYLVAVVSQPIFGRVSFGNTVEKVWRKWDVGKIDCR